MFDELDEVWLRDLILFDRVMVLGSASAAAKALGIPIATASRRLNTLRVCTCRSCSRAIARLPHKHLAHS